MYTCVLQTYYKDVEEKTEEERLEYNRRCAKLMQASRLRRKAAAVAKKAADAKKAAEAAAGAAAGAAAEANKPPEQPAGGINIERVKLFPIKLLLKLFCLHMLTCDMLHT